MDLQSLLSSEPAKSLDFKRDISPRAAFLKTLVAFANGAGGTVLVGVDPSGRAVKGGADPLAVEETIRRVSARGIRPRLVPDVEILSWRQVHLVAVRVHPGPERPYSLAEAGAAPAVYVRSEAEDRLATPEMVEELRQSAGGRGFDEQTRPGTGLEDLDREAMEKAFRTADRTLGEDDLVELRLLSLEGDRRVATTGGLLLFGRRRLDHFPDAWIQAGRFRGGDRAEILDSSDLQGSLPAAVGEAMAFALRNLARGSVIDGLQRTDEPAVPPVALREALLNAVVHADYAQRGAPIRLAIHDDRVEITNPGLLPAGLTLEDLRHGVSKLRNRVIGRVFHALKMVEQWGSGVARMERSMKEAGLPAPEFREVGLSFRVTLSTLRTGEPATDARDEKLLDALAERGALSTSVLATAVGLSDRATRTRLRNLVDRGLVTEIGSGRNDPQRKYALLKRRH
jgi:predicted HTH transcriptional regulator